MPRYCLACDLKEDPDAIEAYRAFHAPENHWPDIAESIREAGIIDMEIYLVGNRLFMIMEVREDFDFERKATLDAANPRVQAWETLMGTFQQPIPLAAGDGNWARMSRIFKL